MAVQEDIAMWGMLAKTLFFLPSQVMAAAAAVLMSMGRGMEPRVVGQSLRMYRLHMGERDRRDITVEQMADL
jgi:hypothetical protein